MSDFMPLDAPIFIAGHHGLVGSAIFRRLKAEGYSNLQTRTREQLDLLDHRLVSEYFAKMRPKFVFLAAAKVGGILANNNYPADFIFQNLVLQNNVLDASRNFGVERLLFLGSSCIYPKLAPQPMPETCLLTSELEPTNRPYAIAKIAGIETCWSFNRQYGTRYLAAMPTNLYGPGDNFDLDNSHVLPALIRKTLEASRRGDHHIVVWGTGAPRRELLFSDDLAKACSFLMNMDDDKFDKLISSEKPPLVNIGTGIDVTIRELAETVCKVLDFHGSLIFDSSKPNGTPRKLMDVTLIQSLGWKHEIDLEEGIRRTVASFMAARSHPL